ncbi:hypothetical protein FACS1894151_08610 [Spirochaetia bacterium]|nr:hypothetical protein FACS1894151_08610 [Spirochaetia bacterium]
MNILRQITIGPLVFLFLIFFPGAAPVFGSEVNDSEKEGVTIGHYDISRYYTGENPVTGSIGSHWAISFDTRIIRGTNSHFRLLEQRYQQEHVDSIRDRLDTLILRFKDTWGTGDNWQNSEGIYAAHLAVLEDLRKAALENKKNVDDLYRGIQGASGIREVINSQAQAQTLLHTIQERIQNYTRAMNEITVQMEQINTMEDQLAEALETWGYYRTQAEKSDRIMEENAPVMYPGTPEYYYNTGLDTLNWIDERGTVHLFVVTDDGLAWKPFDPAYSGISIERNSVGEYILKRKEGITTYYDADGQYAGELDPSGKRVQVSRSGNRIQQISLQDGVTIRFQYNADGKLSRITGPDDRIIHYEYTGDLLTGVTDTNGAAIQYRYEEGILADEEP